MSNIFIGLKMTLFGCFGIENIRGDANETGLMEGGGIEMSTTVLPYTRCSLSSLEYFRIEENVAKTMQQV